MEEPSATEEPPAALKGKAKEEVADGNFQGERAGPSRCSEGTYTLNPPRDITGFVCAKCNAHNLIRSASETWYVVTVGRQVGVFQGW